MSTEPLVESDSICGMRTNKSVSEAFNSDDILCEILARLPLESISRLILVSKRWLQFICSSTFRKHYLTKWPQRFHLLGFFLCNTLYIGRHGDRARRPRSEPALPLLSTCLEGDDLEFSGILKQLGYYIDSSNGLLLCGRHPKTYFVWNPITRERHQLPRPRVHFEALCMAFLVEDCIDDVRYKIIRARCDYGSDEVPSVGLPIETYNSKTRTWNYSTLKCSSSLTLCSLTAATVIKGVVHWYAELGQVAIYDTALDDRFLHVTKLPGSNDYDYRALGESSDGLLQYGWSNLSRMEIWVLEKGEAGSTSVSPTDTRVNRNWKLRYKVNFKIIWKRNPSLKHTKETQILSFLPKNTESVYIRLGSDIYLYHLHSLSVEEVYHHRRGSPISWDINSVVPYFRPSWPHSRLCC